MSRLYSSRPQPRPVSPAQAQRNREVRAHQDAVAALNSQATARFEAGDTAGAVGLMQQAQALGPGPNPFV
jgi:hypothetical protein